MINCGGIIGGGSSWVLERSAAGAEQTLRSISESVDFPAASEGILSSDSEDEETIVAGADFRLVVGFDLEDLLPNGRGGLKAGRPRLAEGVVVVGILVNYSGAIRSS